MRYQSSSARRLVWALPVVALTSAVAQTSPEWWARRGVLTAEAANDFAALNAGQLKHLAYMAWLELDSLPGGAGFEPAFTNAGNDYAAVNIGQLKEIARPFYDRLGSTNAYPWAEGPPGNDYALANIGQAKHLFSFNLPTNVYLVIDLSGGPTATNYPVSYLAGIPFDGWSDEFKTTKLVMRKIPAGTFTMGSPADEVGRVSDEETETPRVVTLTRDFYIGVFEVSQKQWELVTGNRPSYFYNQNYYARRPVESVSYYDIRDNPMNADDPTVSWPQNFDVTAASFMGRLRMKTGLFGFDLPTEAQWEYACRAGTTTALNSGKNLTGTGQDTNMD
jgi:hypothetical protein